MMDSLKTAGWICLGVGAVDGVLDMVENFTGNNVCPTAVTIGLVALAAAWCFENRDSLKSGAEGLYSKWQNRGNSAPVNDHQVEMAVTTACCQHEDHEAAECTETKKPAPEIEVDDEA